MIHIRLYVLWTWRKYFNFLKRSILLGWNGIRSLRTFSSSKDCCDWLQGPDTSVGLGKKCCKQIIFILLNNDATSFPHTSPETVHYESPPTPRTVRKRISCAPCIYSWFSRRVTAKVSCSGPVTVGPTKL